MIPNQERQQEKVAEVEMPAEAVREEPLPPPQEAEYEGRKIYVTKSGEKYNLNRRCDTLKGYRSYERKACEVCKRKNTANSHT